MPKPSRAPTLLRPRETTPSKRSHAQGSAPRSRAADAVLLVCFFGSGLTGLIHEILWTRMITTVIGGAPFAVAIVVTIFMGGLGIGSYIAGPYVDRLKSSRDPLRLYAILEWIIAGYALLVPLIIVALRPVFALLYAHLSEQFLLYHLLTFLACSVVLGLPVLCMGATLPVLCRYWVRQLGTVGRRTGALYALNTGGAAVGAFLGGFLLVPHLGVWGALIAAAVVNLLAGITSWLLARRMPPTLSPELASPGPRQDSASREEPGSRRTVVCALILFGLSGFCGMAYEVIWSKLLSLIVGPTNYSFTIILVTFILGLALGSYVFGRLGDRMSRPESLLIATQIAAAILALTVSQLLGNSQLFFAKLLLDHQDDFGRQTLVKGLVLFAFLIGPTLCLGAAFPLAGKIVSRHLPQVGRSIGRAYAFNSLGAVLGSFTAGFILIPYLGKEAGLSLVVALQLLAAVGTAVLLGPRLELSPGFRRAGIGIAVAALLAACFLPQWNHAVLASSKYHRLESLRPLCQSVGWTRALFQGAGLLAAREPHELLFYGDGIGGFTTVCRSVNALGTPEYWMANSGKFDASSRGDMNTQVLLAHVPMAFQTQANSVLIIGLASGVTGGEILRHPVKHLDLVEINDQAARASRFFEPWNNRLLDDARTRLILQDARAHLSLATTRYDVIISEPSNPWMAGCASLFTREFFQQAKERLSDRGCFVQWLHSYQIDWDSVALIGRTFVDVFPGCLLVATQPMGMGSDYLLVGFKDRRPAAWAAPGLVDFPPSPNVRLKDPRLLHRLVISDDCGALFDAGSLNTDNRPLLEFQAPRQLHRGTADARQIIERLTRHRHALQATLTNLNSVESRLSFAEFALSIFEPSPGLFDWAQASEAQRARSTELILRYAESNEIDLAWIPDPTLRRRCVTRQLELLEARAEAVATNAPACFYQAEMLKAADRFDAALQAYERCVQLDPLHVRAWNEAGILHCRQGRIARGMDYFRRVIALEPGLAETQANLATAYFQSGNRLLARMHFEEALRLDPGLPEARDGLRLLKAAK